LIATVEGFDQYESLERHSAKVRLYRMEGKNRRGKVSIFRKYLCPL